jgi:5'-nucleotidase
VIGHITADLTVDGEDTVHGGSGETTLGDVIADARLASVNAPPQLPNIAFINAGGIRSSLRFTAPDGSHAPGDVTYGEAYSVEPFGDLLYTETLTGAQVLTLIDEQFIGKNDPELLGVSRGFGYTWDASLPDGKSKVVPGSVRFNGKPIDPNGAYRITVDAFLIDGGDGFTVLRTGTNKVSGPIDLDALDAYITAKSPLTPGPRDRVIRLH